MDGVVIAQWVATGVIAGGLLYNIRRNSNQEGKNDALLKRELKSEIESLKEKLDDPDDGLKAIKKSIDEQRLHCAKVSTALYERVGSLEDDVKKADKK